MLTFVLDENVPRRVWRAIQRHNLRGSERLDVVRVGEVEDLPYSTDDAALLKWAERENRILISSDKRTLPVELKRHLQSGNTSPGILMLRSSTPVAVVIEWLILIAHVSEPHEWRDRIEYFP